MLNSLVLRHTDISFRMTVTDFNFVQLPYNRVLSYVYFQPPFFSARNTYALFFQYLYPITTN